MSLIDARFRCPVLVGEPICEEFTGCFRRDTCKIYGKPKEEKTHG